MSDDKQVSDVQVNPAPVVVPVGQETDAQAAMLAQLDEVAAARKAKEATVLADPGNDVKKPSELSQLVGRAVASDSEWTDKHGKKHKYMQLELLDLADFEERHGSLLVAFQAQAGQVNHMLTLVWLSVRKEDCTDAQIDKGEYKYTRPQVGRMFGFLDSEAMATVAMRILKISGLDVETQEGNVEAAGEDEQPPAEA